MLMWSVIAAPGMTKRAGVSAIQNPSTSAMIRVGVQSITAQYIPLAHAGNVKLLLSIVGNASV